MNFAACLIRWALTCVYAVALLVAFLLANGCGAYNTNLVPELQEAADAWGVLEMETVEIHNASKIVLERECLGHTTPEGARIEGCARIAPRRIYILRGLSPERRKQVVVHELGHILRGEGGHLKCIDKPGENVMCSHGGPEYPTEADMAFVFDH